MTPAGAFAYGQEMKGTTIGGLAIYFKP